MSTNQPPKPDALRAPRNTRSLLILLIALCVLFFLSYANRLMERARLLAEVQTWEQRIADAKQRQVALQAELERVHSPDFVDEVAREKLNVGKEGDRWVIPVYATPPVVPQPTPAPTPAPAPSDSEQPANWQRWVDLFAPAPGGGGAED